MASSLPGDVCVGQHSVCLVRAALLGPDCAPVGGVDSGIVTVGIVTATASPELQEGVSLEVTLGCGGLAWTYEEADKIRRFNLTGELAFFDHEALAILFGGDVVVGGAGSEFTGDTIGWAAPNYTEDPAAAVYIEFITRTAAQGVGECATESGDPVPAYVGHIFGRTKLVPGDRTFALEAATQSFTGFSQNNPNLGTGPWGDWPGTGNVPNSPYVQVSYSADEYDAIADLAGCGWQTLPTAS